YPALDPEGASSFFYFPHGAPLALFAPRPGNETAVEGGPTGTRCGRGGAMTPEVRRELQQLLSALCDGALSAAQHGRLEALLEGDPECRRCYLEYVDMHARLLVHPGLPTPAQGGPETPRAEAPETASPPPAPSAAPVGRTGKQHFGQALRYGAVAA